MKPELEFPADFAKSVIRRAKREKRRRQTVAGAAVATLVLAAIASSLAWRRPSTTSGGAALVSTSPAYCPWGSSPQLAGDRGSGEETIATASEVQANPFR